MKFNLPIVTKIIQSALKEDLSWGDITSENIISLENQSTLEMGLREKAVIAGLDIANIIFQELDSDIQWESFVKEGEWTESGTKLANISGKTRRLLMAERVALNFIQRLSGIATITRKFVDEAKKGSAHVKIVDTRKTTPGLRYLERYAVRIGGGHNHRYNLSDAVMMKDNHLAVLKKNGTSIKEAVIKLRRNIPHTASIEVEIDSLSQLSEVLDAGVDIILLDNMDCKTMKNAVEQVAGKARLEASGGIKLEDVRKIAETGVDLISIGALTHSPTSVDIGLDFVN